MRPQADTVLVWTGAPCMYGCAACPIDPSTAPAGIDAGALQQRLAGMPPVPGRLAVLIGGEPFLNKDFWPLVATIRATGGSIGLVTTGRPLVYPQIRARLRRVGLAYLRVQLFGVDAQHDVAVALPGAFEQVLQGVGAWLAEDSGCDVDLALSTRGRDMASLAADLESLAQRVSDPRVQIVVACDPADATPERLAELRQVRSGLAAWNADGDRPLLAWEGMAEAPFADASLLLPGLSPAFVGAVPEACCLGPVAALHEAGLRRREGVRANSFNFVRQTAQVPWRAAAEECLAYASPEQGDPGRRLWLVEDDHLVLYGTDTGDFTAAEIARVKDQFSHLYLDRAAPGVLDDFVEGMRRILPDPVCATCAHRLPCARRFCIVDGPPFAVDEAWIAAHVGGLRGRVLDVGCGEQLYRERLAPLLRSGAVQYTGLDPDPPSLASAQAALPEGRFILGGIEDFQGQAAAYDHVLCLRSLNHVVDVDEAVARMAAVLKPGGSLLIVECIPFAMLRTASQVAAADGAPRAGHQHFRNIASDEVVPLARRRGLRVVQHRPAGFGSTNQWALLLVRA